MTELFPYVSFNGLDVLIAAICLWFVLRGLMTGIIRAVASILGIVLGFVAAAYGSVFLAPFIIPLVQNETLAMAVAFFFDLFDHLCGPVFNGCHFKFRVKDVEVRLVGYGIGRCVWPGQGAAFGLYPYLSSDLYFAASTFIFEGV